jgi:hypothetical protein
LFGYVVAIADAVYGFCWASVSFALALQFFLPSGKDLYPLFYEQSLMAIHFFATIAVLDVINHIMPYSDAISETKKELISNTISQFAIKAWFRWILSMKLVLILAIVTAADFLGMVFAIKTIPADDKAWPIVLLCETIVALTITGVMWVWCFYTIQASVHGKSLMKKSQ